MSEQPPEPTPTARRRPARQGAVRARKPAAPSAAPSPDVKPEPTLTLVCYADGASRGNPGPAAIGGVVLGPGGTVLEEVSEAIGRATNNVAEWRAALAVLDAARRHGGRAIDLRMDSELVVRQLLGRYQVRNETLRPLFEEARALLNAFERATVRHVPRAQNARADRLANAALDRDRQRPRGEGRPGSA